jgi:hypothetical protein
MADILTHGLASLNLSGSENRENDANVQNTPSASAQRPLSQDNKK